MNEIKWHAEIRPCPICGSQKARILGTRGGDSQKEKKGAKTHIVRCLKCCSVYQKPTLLPESNPYVECSATEYFKGHEAREKIKYGKKIVAFAEKLLGKTGKMLELGCGRGELLAEASRCGWTVQGVGITENFAKYARSKNVEVECASVETCKSLEKTWDVILMPALLEHLYDPIGILKRCRNSLRSGGVIFIEVPNECSFVTYVGNAYMRMRGLNRVINLSPTFPPFHVVGFCPVSLRYALNTTGFHVLNLKLHRWNNALSFGRSLKSKVEYVALGLVLSIGKIIGMGSGMTCWAGLAKDSEKLNN